MTKTKARKLLEEERSRLQEIREGILREGSGADGGELSSIDQHPGDLGTETFEHEKNVSLLEQVNDELLQVEAALHRLEQGTYGVCQACGRKIAEERLEALPATRFCVDDQARAERELGLPGTRAWAVEDGNEIRVPYHRAFVEAAPGMGAGGRLWPQEQEALYAYYGLEYTSASLADLDEDDEDDDEESLDDEEDAAVARGGRWPDPR